MKLNSNAKPWPQRHSAVPLQRSAAKAQRRLITMHLQHLFSG